MGSAARITINMNNVKQNAEYLVLVVQVAYGVQYRNSTPVYRQHNSCLRMIQRTLFIVYTTYVRVLFSYHKVDRLNSAIYLPNFLW